MIKRLLTSILALSLTTSSFFILSANADEKDEKAVDKDNIREIKIRANMPEEWLAEHDEFDITFEHDGEKSYVFFDKDNEFERWTELEKGVEYNVIFSDDVDGYDIAGIDDTYTLTDDKATIILAFKKKNDKKTEDKDEDKKEDNNEEKTNDTEEKKQLITDDKIEEYKKQRELVQNLLNAVDSYNDWDKFGYASNESRVYDADFFLTICSVNYSKDSNFEYEDKKAEIVKECDCKEYFLLKFLYTNEKSVFGKFGENNKHDEDERGLSFFKCEEYDLAPYITDFNNLIYPSVLETWKYSQEYYYETGEVPDLYAVYLDIKKGINIDEFIETSSAEEISEAEESSIVESSEAEESSTVIEDSIESASSIGDESSSIAKPNEIKKTFGDIIKDNIITIILAAVLGGALLYIKKIKKKNNDNSNDDY